MTDIELVPVQIPNLVAPVAGAAALVDNQRAYQELCRALLDATDYQQIQGGQFKKKSAWRKLNVAFNVTTELLEEEEQRDDNGRLIRARVAARAIAPNGRYADGIGVCDVHDRHTRGCMSDCTGFRHFSHPEHDILATAHTRATNRASSDLYGMGEVSAEEIDANSPPTPAWDPMILLGPYLEEEYVRAELALWRRKVRLPTPSRLNPEQTAQALVQIGRLLERGRSFDDVTPGDVIDDQPEAGEGEYGTERYVPPGATE